jgi:3-oxoacyl-(acyl-carrier-protein) synthase
MKRVVITGMGVMAPNGNNIPDFSNSLKGGISGIEHIEQLEKLNFRCQVAGVPKMDESILEKYFSSAVLKGLRSTGIKFGCLSAIEAYLDAGLEINTEEPDWDTGCIFGSSTSEVSILKDVINYVDNGEVKKMGSRYVEQSMSSGTSAYISRLFGFSNHVFSNSSACSTGVESVLMSYEKIRMGYAQKMLAGSCECNSHYIWAGFDAMRVLNQKYNDRPKEASRPMSASADGFVPGSGAGALMLEELESAKARGARIYAEILGGAYNSGGQRNGGTMTAPSSVGVRRCISNAIKNARISSGDIDLVSGHLTATRADPIEIGNWVSVLGRDKKKFPYINSPKSMMGHCISAAGSIETIAAVLQLHNNFVHPSINCEDMHPQIAEMIDRDCVPHEIKEIELNCVIKANFGFGDVNSCIVLSKYKN